MSHPSEGSSQEPDRLLGPAVSPRQGAESPSGLGSLSEPVAPFRSRRTAAASESATAVEGSPAEPQAAPATEAAGDDEFPWLMPPESVPVEDADDLGLIQGVDDGAVGQGAEFDVEVTDLLAEEPVVAEAPEVEASWEAELPSWAKPASEEPSPAAEPDSDAELPEWLLAGEMTSVEESESEMDDSQDRTLEPPVLDADIPFREEPAEFAETPEAPWEQGTREAGAESAPISDGFGPAAELESGPSAGPEPGMTTSALEEVAGRLERVAQALRHGRSIELLVSGDADPLEMLVAGYALGYAKGRRARAGTGASER